MPVFILYTIWQLCYCYKKKNKFEKKLQHHWPDTLTPPAEMPLYYIKNEPAKSANMPKPICVCDIFLPRCQCWCDGSLRCLSTHTHLPAEHLCPTFACGPDLKHRHGESMSQDFVSGKNREPPSGSVWTRQTVTSPSHVPALPYPHTQREREEPA